MIIRRANTKDLERVNDLLHQVLEVHALGRPDIFISGSKKYTDEELLSIFENDLTPVFVAEDSVDGVVGYAFCIIKETLGSHILQNRRELYIDDLCVDEKCRGKHIGTVLFRFVEDFAKAEGFDAVTLNVWTLNESAIKFYEKCGFTPLKTVMEKPLGE